MLSQPHGANSLVILMFRHAKHMCVDGVFSTIGSFNFDLYSARRNLEVGVAVFDRNFALKMQERCVCLVQGTQKCFFFVTLSKILKQNMFSDASKGQAAH